MMTRRWFGGAALVACLAMFSGQRPTVAEDKKAAEAEKPSPGLLAIEQSAAAHTVIEFGYANKMPSALIAGAEVLVKIGELEDATDRIKVEGAGEGTVSKFNDQIKKVLADARAMGKDNEAIQKLAAQVEDKLAESQRGAVKGPQKIKKYVVPTRNPSDIPTTCTIKFVGGKNGYISVRKTGNVGVPIHIHLVGPDGKEISHRIGNSAVFDFHVPKDGDYKVKFYNQHTVAVEVEVVTN